MTTEELQALLTTIEKEAAQAADFVGAIDPALIPFIAIGKAVASQVPSAVAMVANIIKGNPPTQAEKDQLKAELGVLSDPNLP